MQNNRRERYTSLYRYLFNRHFWFITALTLAISFNYYASQIGTPLIPWPKLPFDMAQHTLDRLLYLIPIIYSYSIFNLRGGLIALLSSLVITLPDAIFISSSASGALAEIIMITVISIVILLYVNRQREQKDMLKLTIDRLENAQQKLHNKVRTAMEQENRLAVITEFSALLSQSMNINQVIQTAIDMVMEVMQVEVVLIFSLDHEAKELRITGFEGVNDTYASAVDRMKLGKGFCGRVAETGQPLIIEDASLDSTLSNPAAAVEMIKAQLSVPLKFNGRIIGTLCAATKTPHKFNHEEVELLTAIGNLIGIAIENSRLNHEREVAIDQLKHSEKKYRQLFENAHDAIWVQDVSGMITGANQAAADLFGYAHNELIGTNIRQFIPADELSASEEVRERLISGLGVQQPYTRKLVKKDGAETILMVTTNIISSNDHPDGFQFIGRDITKQVQMQENLRFYLQQITQAHEDERQRISRDLHDSTAQNLIAILHQLDNFCQTDEYLPMPKLRSLWSLHEQLKDLLQEIRQLSRDLRPSILDDLGLLAAVEWLAEQVKTEHKICAKLIVQGQERRFSPEIEVSLFRIIQEALRNTVRHADATKTIIGINFNDNETLVTISDNGRGFELPTTLGELSRLGKLGLDGMQTRARLVGGAFDIKTSNENGTTISITIPA